MEKLPRLKRLGIEKVDCLVDVGAYKGSFIDEVNRSYSPKIIYAAEPQENLAKELQKKNFDVDLTVFNVAVGSEKCRGHLNIYSADQASSLLYLLPEVDQKYGCDIKLSSVQEVEVFRLDDLIPSAQHVDLLKIDVQGSEDAVIKGAHETLWYTQHVIIEMNCIPQYLYGSEFDSVNRSMKSNGFTLAHLFAPNCGVENDLDYDERIILHCDAHFVRS